MFNNIQWFSGGITEIRLNCTHDLECRIDDSTTATATFLAKADGILAGLAIADAVFEACDSSLMVTWTKADGDRLAIGDIFGTVTGNARAILRAERVALNFMQVRIF